MAKKINRLERLEQFVDGTGQMLPPVARMILGYAEEFVAKDPDYGVIERRDALKLIRKGLDRIESGNRESDQAEVRQ